MSIETIQLKCGATLLVEPIDNVASVALNWLLPMGSGSDPADGDGRAALLSELIFRGAGGMSSREHSDALDRLGIQRTSSVHTHHMRIGMTALGTRLAEGLDLIAQMVLAPTLPEDALEPVRSLCLQSLDSLDDDPQHLVMLRLHAQHVPPPFNRTGYGDRAVLARETIESLRASWQQRCRPVPTIISAAGAVDPAALASQLDKLLTDWSGTVNEPIDAGPARRGQVHDIQDTAQVHIGLAYDAPAESDEDAIYERLGIAVLSGGTSARLFTEVRQKRSLCYSVGASYRAGRDRGLVTLYAGTTPERAQETLEVSAEEICRMQQGVTDEELARAVVGLKSSLIMQGESTSARASTIAIDHYRLGRARTLEEISRAIDAVSLDDLNAYLARRQYGPFTVSTIGPSEIKLGETVAP